MAANSIDELKGFLIKIDFNFDTKRFDFYVGFPDGWVVDLNVDEISVVPTNEGTGVILYIISSNDDNISSDLVIKYILNVIKYNKKIAQAKEKIEKQKLKLEEKFLNDGKSSFAKEIAETKPVTAQPKQLAIASEITHTSNYNDSNISL